MLVIFFLINVGFCCFGFAKGRPFVTNPWDMDGNQCGLSLGYEEYP